MDCLTTRCGSLLPSVSADVRSRLMTSSHLKAHVSADRDFPAEGGESNASGSAHAPKPTIVIAA